MKIYKKNELRDIIIAFCVLGAILTVAAIVKDKENTNSRDTKKVAIHLTPVQQKGKVLE